MKNRKAQFIVGGMLVLCFVISILPATAHTKNEATDSVICKVDFSTPALHKNTDFTEITLHEANGLTTTEGCPCLPQFSKTFEFPLGTHILAISIQQAPPQLIAVEQPIQPVPTRQKIGNQIIPCEGIKNQVVYASADLYPPTWYTISSGAGLNNQNDHTLFVTVHFTPVRYIPATQLVEFSSSFTVQITFEPATPAVASTETSSLVIIAPAEFSELLQPLVDHKNAVGLPTTLVTLDDIYSTYYGRDQAEQIKYFIEHAVDDWDTQYVLLVGDMKKLPIRVTYASWWEPNLLSDLYYADLYDAGGEFCTWDGNGNNRFGEIDHEGNDLDGVDLYADVHIGRLACVDATEVSTVVNKIITYEEQTFNQIWFKRLVCAGGDTFPLSHGAPPFIYEGEITNIKVGQTMPDFDQTYLWTSKHNLHFWSFNRAINKGAGFVSYAGHGFEHGWATFRPNAVIRSSIFYYTPYVYLLKNGNKLPIIFFDACLTAKLDFNVTSLQEYYPRAADLLVRILGLSSDPAEFYQCFAWIFLAKENGGAIATIGATRTAYTWVDANGVYGGAGYLDVHFFDSYTEGITVGQMLTGAQNAYIQNVGPDYFTIEEFILLGDPSLKTGGY